MHWIHASMKWLYLLYHPRTYLFCTHIYQGVELQLKKIPTDRCRSWNAEVNASIVSDHDQINHLNHWSIVVFGFALILSISKKALSTTVFITFLFKSISICYRMPWYVQCNKQIQIGVSLYIQCMIILTFV